MPNVKKNSFYKLNLISGAVALNPRFKDMPFAKGDTTYELKSGIDPFGVVMEGKIADAPHYGEGVLKAGWLRTYCTGLSISGSSSLPKVNIYNMDDGVFITEPNTSTGWDFPAEIGNNVSVFSSQFDPDEVWLGEYFDGADKSLGAIQALGTTPGANLSLKDVYLSIKDASSPFFGGDAFLVGTGESNDVDVNLEKYFSMSDRVYMQPLKKNRMKGLWTVAIDKREGKSKWAVYAPFYKWKDIQPLLQFGGLPPPSSGEELDKEANTNNTIFGLIEKSGDFGNAFLTTGDSPLLESVVQISSQKAQTGGTSLRLYHQWQTSEEANRSIEASLGEYGVNGQVIKACVYDIPSPPALDMGAFDFSVSSSTGPASAYSQTVSWTSGSTIVTGAAGIDFDETLETGNTVKIEEEIYKVETITGSTIITVDRPPRLAGVVVAGTGKNIWKMSTNLANSFASGAHLTDKRVVFPEININMNISKLFPSPALNPNADSDRVGEMGRIYYMGGRRVGRSAYGTTYDWPDTDTVLNAEGNAKYWTKGGPLKTFLRSVVITFSSYKPDSFATLDDFLDYGMNRYYLEYEEVDGKSPNDTQLCGIVFTRDYGNAETKTENGNLDGSTEYQTDLGAVYAYALPVTKWIAPSGASHVGDPNDDEDPDKNSGADINTDTYGSFGPQAFGGMALIDNSPNSKIFSATKKNAGVKLMVHNPKFDEAYWDPDLVGSCKAGTTNITDATTRQACELYYDDTAEVGGAWTPRDYTNQNGCLEPHWVKIPLDTFFNMKIVFDKYAPFGGESNLAGGLGEGATYSYRDYHTGLPTDYNVFANQSGNHSWGVPIRAYFEGGLTGSTNKQSLVTRRKSGPSGSSIDELPYINIPLMWHEDPGEETDVTQQDFDFHSNSFEGMPESWPKYMTIWVNNYRYTKYSEDSPGGGVWTGALFKGSELDPTRETDPDTATDELYQHVPAFFRGADSRLYGNAVSGSTEENNTDDTKQYLNPETEVFIDSIEFKYFNHSITNHSTQAGTMQRFINLENTEILSPVTTYTDNTVGLGGRRVSNEGGANWTYTGSFKTPVTGATDIMTLKGFEHSGKLAPRNPGYTISIGVKEDPYDYFPINNDDGGGKFIVGQTVDMYLLWNNFSTNLFGKIEQLDPVVAFKPMAGALSSGMIEGDETNYSNTLGVSARGRNWASGTMISGGSGPIDNRAAWSGDGYTYSQEGAGYNWYPTTAADETDDYRRGLDGTFCMGSGANQWASSDGLTQKGFTRWSMDMSYNTQEVAMRGQATITFTSGSTTCECTAFDDGGGTLPDAGDLEISSGIIPSNNAIVELPSNTLVATLPNVGSRTPPFDIGLTKAPTGNYTTQSDKVDFFGAGRFDKWQRAPNSMVAAKIMGVPGSLTFGGSNEDILSNKFQIRVDTTDIFTQSAEDEYLIYRIDGKGRKYQAHFEALPESGTSEYLANCLGYANTVTLAHREGGTSLPSDVIELAVTSGNNNINTGVIVADDGITDLCVEANIGELWISPLRYWVNLTFVDDNLNFRRSYESINAIQNRPAGHDGEGLDANRGSTFNEWKYSYVVGSTGSKGLSGMYEKPWILGDAENSSLILSTDYGYGTFSEEDNTGGQLGESTAVLNQYMESDISGIVSQGGGGGSMGGGAATNQRLNLYVELSNQNTDKIVELVGDDSVLRDAFLPTLVWEFHDSLPQITKFEVSPAFNALEKDVNLYDLTNENLNSLNFSWEEGGEDIWYRVLMVDTEDIKDKYHKCSFHMPLNEFYNVTPSGSRPQVPTYKFYDYVSNNNNYPTGGAAIDVDNTSTCRTSLDGLAGYAFQGQADTDFLTVPRITYGSAANESVLLSGMSEYTFVVHAIPTSADAGNYIFSQGDYDGTSTWDEQGFFVYINTDKKVVVRHRTVILTGTSTQLCDGETPLNIIVTYLSGTVQAGRQPLELYVNGVLEDYNIVTDTPAIGTDGFDTSDDGYVGGAINPGGTALVKPWAGKIEEIVLYTKRWDIVTQASDYIFNSERLNDKVAGTYTGTGKRQSQNAKLFIFDYHNIRGHSSDVVAQSNLIGWKVTTI